ncbi:MAG: hypothetical protein AABY22_15655 [Nanoarchaeota archaeon]|mgnify:CR=1 FL=1
MDKVQWFKNLSNKELLKEGELRKLELEAVELNIKFIKTSLKEEVRKKRMLKERLKTITHWMEARIIKQK